MIYWDYETGLHTRSFWLEIWSWASSSDCPISQASWSDWDRQWISERGKRKKIRSH